MGSFQRVPGVNDPGGREYNEAYYYGLKKTGNESTAIKYAQWYMANCVGQFTPKEAWQQAPDWMTAPQ